MSRDRLSKDQKRKKKLAAKAKAEAGTAVVPYAGDKYKDEEWVPVHYRVDVGIHTADLVSEGRLVDRDVKNSLEYLVGKLRGESPPLPPFPCRVVEADGSDEDLVTAQILSQCRGVMTSSGRPVSARDLIGVIRTILHSMTIWSRPVPGCHRYLDYLTGFLRKAGAQVEVRRADGPGLDEPAEVSGSTSDQTFSPPGSSEG